jgi:heptosyltransferase II
MSVGLIKFIDRFFGIPYCIVLGIINLFSKRKLPIKEKTKNILIIQLWGIGETILTVPAIKALKEKYNKTSIEILCTKRNKDVYFNYPFISKLNIVKLNLFSLKWFILKNWKKYNIVIDMEEYLNISAIMAFFLGKRTIGYSHGVRSLVYSKRAKYNDKQHTSKTFFDLVKVLDVKGTVKKLEKLNYTGTDKKIVDLALKYSGIKKHFLIGIAPGAAESSKSRMWPVENFAQLIEKICSKKKNAKIILIGADYEKKLNNSIINLISSKRIKNNVFNYAGKFTLKQTFYLISKCNVFIGNDSGPMHIGAAMGVKTIGLFGPNLPVRFGPLNKKSKAIYKQMPCSPCINVHKGQVPECMHGETNRDYQKCMKEIKVKDVLKYV